MRKRLFLVALFMIPLLSIYSEPGFGYGTDVEDVSATVEVVLDVSSISVFDIGFSRNKIDDINDVIDLIKEESVNDLELNEEISSAEGRIYLYWVLMNPKNVSASISIPSALQGKNGEIDWSVSVVEEEEKVISSTEEETELPVLEVKDSWAEVGSAELYINTENLNHGESIPGEYIGELRLKILTD